MSCFYANDRNALVRTEFIRTGRIWFGILNFTGKPFVLSALRISPADVHMNLRSEKSQSNKQSFYNDKQTCIPRLQTKTHSYHHKTFNLLSSTMYTSNMWKCQIFVDVSVAKSDVIKN